MRKFLCALLCFVFLLNTITPVLADENEDEDAYIDATVEKFDEISFAQDVYASLDNDGRAVFEYEIANDAELLAFHRVNVDPTFDDFSVMVPPQLDAISSAFGRNPLETLYAELASLSLPVAVLYSMKALGIAMTLAFVDGVLPVGDILTIAAGVGTVVVASTYWNSVCQKWDDIVDAFNLAFSSISTTVNAAFVNILNQIKARLQVHPALSYKGRQIVINGEEFLCTTRADYISEKDTAKYYPAIRYGGSVWVATTNPLTLEMAKVIMYCNSGRVGVWATLSTYARGLCGGVNAIHDPNHRLSEGYFYHYHHPVYTKFHCWYLF